MQLQKHITVESSCVSRTFKAVTDRNNWQAHWLILILMVVLDLSTRLIWGYFFSKTGFWTLTLSLTNGCSPAPEHKKWSLKGRIAKHRIFLRVRKKDNNRHNNIQKSIDYNWLCKYLMRKQSGNYHILAYSKTYRNDTEAEKLCILVRMHQRQGQGLTYALTRNQP